MQENGFWEGGVSRAVKVGEILPHKGGLPPLITVSSNDRLARAVSLVQEFNISQLPVIDSGEIVGSLNEASLMQLLHDGIDFQLQDIKSVMGKPLPALDENTDVSEAYRILLSGATGVVVKRKELPIGLVTRTDLVNYWISRKKGD
jgi:cystathionine beta-synthase